MRRAVFGAGCAAMAAVHAVVALWTPVEGDAWLHWVWAGRHPDAGVGTWLAAHLTSADAIGYLLARFPAIHVVVSPVVAIALVMGLFTVALRRTPRATGEDLLGLALISALIWIGQPHAGMTWFYTPSVAMHVYGAAAAVWLIAPFRCGWRVPRVAWPALVLAGYTAGTSTRAIATLTLVVVIALMRGRRARWMWLALGALVVGTTVGYIHAPHFEIGKVFRRGLDPNLYVLRVPVEAIGKIVSLVAVFALVDLGRGAFGRARVAADGRPDPRESAVLLVMYLATSVWCIFGPKYYEATLFPATCVLVVAALPWLLWFATARGHRLALVAFAVAVHAIAWTLALVDYHWIGAEGGTRLALLERARPGETVTVPAYREILPSPMFFGEDFMTARLRQLVAVDAFGLRDIVVEPPFRHLESNPGIDVTFEQDGASAAELRSARVPAILELGAGGRARTVRSARVPARARDRQASLGAARRASGRGRPGARRPAAPGRVVLRLGADQPAGRAVDARRGEPVHREAVQRSQALHRGLVAPGRDLDQDPVSQRLAAGAADASGARGRRGLRRDPLPARRGVRAAVLGTDRRSSSPRRGTRTSPSSGTA